MHNLLNYFFVFSLYFFISLYSYKYYENAHKIDIYELIIIDILLLLFINIIIIIIIIIIIQSFLPCIIMV